MSDNPSRGIVLEALAAVIEAIFKHAKGVTAPIVCFALHPGFEKNLLFNGSGLCPELDLARRWCTYHKSPPVVSSRVFKIFDRSFLVGALRCIWESPKTQAKQACFLASPNGIRQGFGDEMLSRTNDILFNGEGDILNEADAIGAVIMLVLRPKSHPAFARHIVKHLRDGGSYRVERKEDITARCGWAPRGCVVEFYLLVK